MMTKEKPLELLTLVTAFVHQKYPKKKIYGACYYLRQTFFHCKYKRGYYL